MYSAHSNIGRGNLVLRLSVSLRFFVENCVLIDVTQRRTFALVPERRNENIDSSFPRVGIEPTIIVTAIAAPHTYKY